MRKVNWGKLEGLDFSQIFGVGVFCGLVVSGVATLIISEICPIWWIILISGILVFVIAGGLVTYFLLLTLEDEGL